MANRTLSHAGDRTVSILIKLPTSLKLAVEDLSKKSGKSMSGLFREWAADQVDSHETELMKIEQEELRAEAELNIIRAQKSQLISELDKKQAMRQTRQQLMENTTERLVKCTQIIDFTDPNFIRIAKNNLNDMNAKIVSANDTPVTYEELVEVTTTKAKERGKYVFE